MTLSPVSDVDSAIEDLREIKDMVKGITEDLDSAESVIDSLKSLFESGLVSISPNCECPECGFAIGYRATSCEVCRIAAPALAAVA